MLYNQNKETCGTSVVDFTIDPLYVIYIISANWQHVNENIRITQFLLLKSTFPPQLVLEALIMWVDQNNF